MRNLITKALVISMMLAGVAVAPTAAAYNGQQVVYLTKIKAGTNKACKPGLHKEFIVRMSVPKGQKIQTFTKFTLKLQKGTMVQRGFRVSNSHGRVVEYYFFPQQRNAKVSTELARSYTFVELTEGATAKATVEAMCLGRP